MRKDYKTTLEDINSTLENLKRLTAISDYDKETNTSIIKIDLSTGDIYQSFSNEKILSEDIFEYIDHAFHFRRKNSKVLFEIKFPEGMASTEQEKVKQLIELHYAVQLKQTNQEIKQTNIKGTISLAIGAVLFAIFGVLEWYNVNFIFRGIIEIFSWVFIWEACNCYAFTNSRNKLNRLRYFYLFKASRKLQG